MVTEINEEVPESINVENADFTNKNKMINSPRTLKACKELGILPTELYKLSMDDYKKKDKTYFTLDQNLLKVKYEGYEKFRNDSIALVRKRREILILREKENDAKEKDKFSKKSKSEINYLPRSIEKLKMENKML